MDVGRYDFWLVDLDGTVVDIDPRYPRKVFDRVGRRLGRRFTDDEVSVIWHGLNGSRDDQLREWGLDVNEFWRVFHEEENPRARAAATFVYDDAVALAALDRPVGLVTHCQEYLARPVVDRLGIRDWFDVMVCCTDDTGWKPDPAPVRLAMQQLGVFPGETGGFVGDGASDMEAARNAGLAGIHVARPGRWRPERVPSDYRVDSLEFLRG